MSISLILGASHGLGYGEDSSSLVRRSPLLRLLVFLSSHGLLSRRLTLLNNFCARP